MQRRQAKELATFTRVTVFLTALPPGTTVGDIAAPLAELERVVATLTEHGSAQDIHNRLSRADTQQLASARRLLLVHQMRPIASSAAALLKVQGGYDRALTMPEGKVNAQALVAAATGMGAAALPYAAFFTQHGLPQDFLARLASARDAVQAAVTSHAKNIGQRRGATAALKTAVTRGRALLKMLDAIVTPALEHKTALLGAWRTAKGSRRPANAPSVGGTTPAATAPAPTTPAVRAGVATTAVAAAQAA